MKKDDAIFNVLRDQIKGIKSILFEGDGYSEEIRYHCDKLELIVDASLWPMAKYRQLLFMQ